MFPEARVLFVVLAHARPEDFKRLSSDASFADSLIESLALDRSEAASADSRHLDGIVLGVLLAFPRETFNKTSSLRGKLEAEFRALNLDDRSHRTRESFLRGALDPPMQSRDGFGTKAALEAVLFELDIVE